MNTIDSPYWPLETEKQLRLLYDRYKESFYRRAFYVLKQELVAEEVVQDVFISIWQNRDRAREQVENLDAYLQGILKRKIFDSLRRIVKDKVIAYVDAEREEDVVNDWYDAKELRALLQELMTKMPEKQRLVFELIRFDGLKREEVAQKLGISSHTVKNHLLAATKFLKENMDTVVIIYMGLYISENIFTIH